MPNRDITKNQCNSTRDDVWPSLFLQRNILVDISSGWRPLKSQARRAKQPLPERPFASPPISREDLQLVQMLKPKSFAATQIPPNQIEDIPDRLTLFVALTPNQFAQLCENKPVTPDPYCNRFGLRANQLTAVQRAGNKMDVNQVRMATFTRRS